MSTISTQGSNVGTVAASTSSVVIAGYRPQRKGFLLYNAGTGNLFIAFWATAATTSAGGYTVKIVPGATYEMGPNIYGGSITGIWDASGGNAEVTEWF